MNLFYTNLDTRFTKFNVYNVLTMADDFMVVSGMPNNVGMIQNCTLFHLFSLFLGDNHVVEIASMALDLLAGSVVFQIPHKPNAKLNIRMGFHRWYKRDEGGPSLNRKLIIIIIKWSRNRSCRRDENPELLRDV